MANSHPSKQRNALIRITSPYSGLRFRAHRDNMLLFEVGLWPSNCFSTGSRAHMKLADRH